MSSRDRRALRLGAFVSLPLLLWSLAVKPYRAALAGTRAEIERERSLLERELTLLAHAPRMPQDLREARRASASSEQRLFVGNDVIEATSSLSSHVGRALRTAGLVVQQVESRDAAEERNGLRQISIDVRSEGSLAGVLRALRSLESGGRLVRVTRISVEKSLASAPGTAELLVLSATVRGYAVVGGVGQ